jgi:hypothetical protein
MIRKQMCRWPFRDILIVQKVIPLVSLLRYVSAVP